MIRWSEHADSSRVTVSRLDMVAAVVASSIGLIAFVAVTQSRAAAEIAKQGLARGDGDEWVCGAVPLMLGIAAGGTFLVASQLGKKAWAEVAIRGGAVLYQFPGMDGPSHCSDITCFRGDRSDARRPTVVAVRSNGEVLRILGPWYEPSRKCLETLAEGPDPPSPRVPLERRRAPRPTRTVTRFRVFSVFSGPQFASARLIARIASRISPALWKRASGPFEIAVSTMR